MTYDENTILEFGAASAAILCNPAFNRLLEAWDHTTVVSMLSTKPEQRDERERLFATVNAVRDFIGFMNEFIVQAKRINEPHDPSAQIDNPAVHDIYRETDYQ